MTRHNGMRPRVGAVATGMSGIVYLLLERVEASDRVASDERCWSCLTLDGGRFSPQAAGYLAVVREEWLLGDAEEIP